MQQKLWCPDMGYRQPNPLFDKICSTKSKCIFPYRRGDILTESKNWQYIGYTVNFRTRTTERREPQIEEKQFRFLKRYRSIFCETVITEIPSYS